MKRSEFPAKQNEVDSSIDEWALDIPCALFHFAKNWPTANCASHAGFPNEAMAFLELLSANGATLGDVYAKALLNLHHGGSAAGKMGKYNLLCIGR